MQTGDIMYVLERSGVTWDERFYVGTTTFFPWSMWGDLEQAHKFENKSKAVRTSYRVDEEGFYTTVEEYDSFEIASL
jgi:hypothetical protein